MSGIIDLSNPEVFRSELEPVAERLLYRHVNSAEMWFPHEYIPYSRGQDFDKDYEWKPTDSDLGGAVLTEGVRSALYVNLLTEDNLPYYLEDLVRMFGKEGTFGEWNKLWTAEEGRHSIAIRDYLIATRAIDPRILEIGRMAQVTKGEVPTPETPLVGVIYVALQELATRIAHRNTGRSIGDLAGQKVMNRVGADENLHFLFYRDLGGAALEINPSQVVITIEKVVREFEMPGTGIPEYAKHTRAIAAAGIYSLLIQVEKVFKPVILNQYKINNLSGLTPDAEKAREEINARLDRLTIAGQRLANRALERASQSVATD